MTQSLQQILPAEIYKKLRATNDAINDNQIRIGKLSDARYKAETAAAKATPQQITAAEAAAAAKQFLSGEDDGSVTAVIKSTAALDAKTLSQVVIAKAALTHIESELRNAEKLAKDLTAQYRAYQCEALETLIKEQSHAYLAAAGAVADVVKKLYQYDHLLRSLTGQSTVDPNGTVRRTLELPWPVSIADKCPSDHVVHGRQVFWSFQLPGVDKNIESFAYAIQLQFSSELRWGR